MERPRLTGTSLSFLLLAAVSAPGRAAEGGGLASLEGAAEELLEERMDAGALREYRLRFDDGVLFHHVYVEMTPDGRQRAPVELRAFHGDDGWTRARLTTPVERLARRLQVDGIDCTALGVDGDAIRGEVVASVGRQSRDVEMGRGENSHSMMKAGRKPVTDWHIGGRERVRTSPLRFEVEARVLADAHDFVLRLDAFAGDPRPERIPDPDDATQVTWDEVGAREGRERRPLELHLRKVGDRWSAPQATTPTWNLASHLVDASGLEFDGGRLHGLLKIVLVPDAWVGGEPRHIDVDLDLPVAYGRIDGRYRASGDQGDYAGAIRGSVWRAIAGRYRKADVDGEWEGALTGRVRDVPDRIAALAGLEVPGDGPLATYARIHGLLVAARDHPAHLRRDLGGLLHARRPADAGERDRWIAGLEGFANGALRDLREGRAPATGHHRPADRDFGPFTGDVALGDAPVPAVDATAPQTWRFLDGWTSIGPFSDHRANPVRPLVLPEVVPGVAHLDARRKFGEDHHVRLEWVAAHQDGIEVTPNREVWNDLWVAFGKMSSYSKHPLNRAWRSIEDRGRSMVWYATRVVESEEARDSWLAIQALDFAQVWVDGSPVWDSGERYGPGVPAVVPIRLKEGGNRILVRCGLHRASYQPSPTWLRCWIALQGSPRDTVEIARDSKAERAAREADPDRVGGYHRPTPRRHASTPPIAWDLDEGINVRWRTACGRGGQPVVSGERIVLLEEPNVVRACSREDGEELWRRAVPGELPEPDRKGELPALARTVPIVTEDAVYACFGHGVLSRLDLDGAVVWAERVSPTPGRSGHGQSPLLLDGVLYVVVPSPPEDGRGRTREHRIVAVDAATGAVRWRSEPAQRSATSLAIVRAVRGSAERHALVTGTGQVYAVEDGRRLFDRALVCDCGPDEAPVVEGSRVYFAGSGGQACWRFWIAEDGRLACRDLWSFRRGGHGGNAGVVADGVFFVPRTADEFHPHNAVCWVQTDCYDADTGQHLAKPKPTFYDALTPTPSLVAGEYCVIGDSGTAHTWTRKKQGQIGFLSLGEIPELVTWNELGDGTPLLGMTVADGALYVRTGGELIAIAVDDDEGRLYQERRRAELVLQEIGRRPRTIAVIEPEPIPDFDPHESAVPVSVLRHNIAPFDWLMLGPVLKTEVDPLPGGAGSLAFDPATPVEVDGETLRWKPMPEGGMLLKGLTRSRESEGVRYRLDRAIDIFPTIDRRERTTSWFQTVLEVPKPCTMEFETNVNGCTFHLGGKPIARDDVIRLRPGCYTLLLRLDVTNLPPVGRPIVAPTFFRHSDPRDDRRRWRQRIADRRGDLERIIAELPDSGQAVYAREWLAALEGSAAEE